MKELSSYTPAELLALMEREHRGEDIRYLLTEVVQEYVERFSTELGWMGMDEPMGHAVMAVAYGDATTKPEDGSTVQQLCNGLMHAIYRHAMKDCAAMLGVKSVDDLENAVLNFAESRDYGRAGEVPPLGQYPNLIADIERASE